MSTVTPSGPLLTAAPGQRWVVRVRLPDGSATDVIGWVVHVDADQVLLAGPIDPVSGTAAGPWMLRRADVVASRRLPDAPGGPSVDRTSAADLERLAAPGWAAEIEPLGDWLLRFAGGFTGRANSCLAVGDPGLPIPDAAEAVVAYAAVRGIPARVQVIEGSTEDVALRSLGWTEVYVPTDVWAARLAQLLDGRPTDRAVVIEETLTARWRAGFDQSRPSTADPAAVTAVLSGRAPCGYASVLAEDRAIALARGHLARHWLGLTAVWTAPEHRRRGLATALTLGLGHWAARRGCRYAYLQVATANIAAQDMYAGLGFSFHHRYHYLAPPDAP